MPESVSPRRTSQGSPCATRGGVVGAGRRRSVSRGWAAAGRWPAVSAAVSPAVFAAASFVSAGDALLGGAPRCGVGAESLPVPGGRGRAATTAGPAAVAGISRGGTGSGSSSTSICRSHWLSPWRSSSIRCNTGSRTGSRLRISSSETAALRSWRSSATKPPTTPRCGLSAIAGSSRRPTWTSMRPCAGLSSRRGIRRRSGSPRCDSSCGAPSDSAPAGRAAAASAVASRAVAQARARFTAG